MHPQAESFIELMQSHRSIRQYRPDPVDPDLLKKIIQCGLRSSSSGNMQTWSVVVSQESAQKERLFQAHYKQKMVLQAPLVLTFCADVHRKLTWLKAHNSKTSFDDLVGFMTATIDAVIAAQSVALAAEAYGLGICYMGTTLWNSTEISEILELPDNVVAVTSLVMGYPDEEVELRDRLSLDSIMFEEKYKSFSRDEILEIYRERESSAWERYSKMDGMLELLKEKGITKLSDYYTSEIKYSKELHREKTQRLLELLKKKKFWE